LCIYFQNRDPQKNIYQSFFSRFAFLVGRLFEQANGRTCLVSGSCTLSRKIFKQQAFGCFNRKIGIWPGFCPAVYRVCGITAGRLPANGDNLL